MLKTINPSNCKDIIGQLFGSHSLNSLEDFVALKKTFEITWSNVNPGDADENTSLDVKKRQLFCDTFIELFNKQVSLFAKEKGDDLLSLHFLATLLDTTFDKQGNIERQGKYIEITLQSLFVDYLLSKDDNWDKVFENYCHYVETHDVMLSGDEIGCLAKRWGAPLCIHFNDESVYQKSIPMLVAMILIIVWCYVIEAETTGKLNNRHNYL